MSFTTVFMAWFGLSIPVSVVLGRLVGGTDRGVIRPVRHGAVALRPASGTRPILVAGPVSPGTATVAAGGR